MSDKEREQDGTQDAAAGAAGDEVATPSQDAAAGAAGDEVATPSQDELVLGSSNLSQRERRRQRYQKEKPAISLTPGQKRNIVLGGIIFLIVGGVVAGVVYTHVTTLTCSQHWHNTIDIILDGDKIVLNGPGDTRFLGPGSPHMHGPDGGINLIHNHRNGACDTFGDQLRWIDAGLSANRLTLGSPHGDLAGSYAAGDGNILEVWGQEFLSEEWQQLDTAGLSRLVLPSASRIAIIWGPHTPEEVQTLLREEATPFHLPQSYGPVGDDHYVTFAEMRRP